MSKNTGPKHKRIIEKYKKYGDWNDGLLNKWFTDNKLNGLTHIIPT